MTIPWLSITTTSSLEDKHIKDKFSQAVLLRRGILVRCVGVVTRESGKKLIPRFLYAYGRQRLMQDISTLHIGSLIREQMTRKGIKVSWLAQQLGCHRNNIYLIFSRSWIDTETLVKISDALEYNFFEDISRWYKQK